MTNDGNHLILSDFDRSQLRIWTKEGQSLYQGNGANSWFLSRSLHLPAGIEIRNNKLYIIDRFHIHVWRYPELTFLTNYKLPPGLGGMELKVDINEKYIYFTLDSSSHIWKLNLLDRSYTSYRSRIVHGIVIRDFIVPTGLTLDEKYLYFCERENHSIQVIRKETGEWEREWGKYGTDDGEFVAPAHITLYDNHLYVRDLNRVQVFSKKGQFVQSIQISNILNEGFISGGLTIMDDTLYCATIDTMEILVFG
jgi:hypothetical protein